MDPRKYTIKAQEAIQSAIEVAEKTNNLRSKMVTYSRPF